MKVNNNPCNTQQPTLKVLLIFALKLIAARLVQEEALVNLIAARLVQEEALVNWLFSYYALLHSPFITA
jgi:hypothetical protein